MMDAHRSTWDATETEKPRPSLPNHGWTKLTEAQGNMDALPARYVPPTGCPECGSVWTHVAEVAFPNTCYSGVFVPERWAVHQVGSVVRVGGVRLGCYGGHLVEFDGEKLTVVPPVPTWSTLGLGLGIYAIAGYMLAMMGRGKAAP